MNEGGKPDKWCQVCGDKASGKHYGVSACDGCRGFFKRSIRRNLQYVCTDNNRCVVDVLRRNHCKACRFTKCLEAKMKRSAVQHERAPLRRLKDHQKTVLQNLGYTYGRQTNLFPTSQPSLLNSPFTQFPPYGTYSTSPTDSLTFTPHHFLESPIQNYPKVPDSISVESSQQNALAISQVGPLSGLSAFNIPFIPTPLHYPFPYGYFPTHLFYPHMGSPDAVSSTGFLKLGGQQETSQEQNATFVENKNALIQENVKEDEVTSSVEALKKVEDIVAQATEHTSSGSSTSNIAENNFGLNPNTVNENCLNEKRIDKPVTIQSSKNAINGFDLFLEENLTLHAQFFIRQIKWTQTLPNFCQLKLRERKLLILCNWKELFVLTAAQWAANAGEGITRIETTAQLSVRSIANRLLYFVKRMNRHNLDDTEFHCLKSALLYRPLDLNTIPNHFEVHEEEILSKLQEHCSRKNEHRFGRVMLLLPDICSFANDSSLEELVSASLPRDIAITDYICEIIGLNNKM